MVNLVFSCALALKITDMPIQTRRMHVLCLVYDIRDLTTDMKGALHRLLVREHHDCLEL